MIQILVLVDTVVLRAAVVTIVIQVLILASTDQFLTTVVTVVIQILVLVDTVVLRAAIVTIVIQVLILAGTNQFLTTVVTVVILIGIFVDAVVLRAAVVTIVIQVLILTSTDLLGTASVTIMVMVLVHMVLTFISNHEGRQASDGNVHITILEGHLLLSENFNRAIGLLMCDAERMDTYDEAFRHFEAERNTIFREILCGSFLPSIVFLIPILQFHIIHGVVSRGILFAIAVEFLQHSLFRLLILQGSLVDYDLTDFLCITVGTVTDLFAIFYVSSRLALKPLAKAMAQRVNSDVLTAQFRSADRAVNHIVIATIVHAIGIHIVFNHGLTSGVTQSVNGDGLTAQFCSADRAINHIVIATSIDTIGFDVVFNNHRALGVTNHNQASIHRRHMVRIHNNTDIAVGTNLSVGNLINEGNSDILRQLSQDIHHFVDVGIQLISAEANQVNQLSGDLIDHLITVSRNQLNQLRRSRTVLVEVVVCKICIHPSGQICIDNSIELACADFGIISGNATGDQNDIGLDIAAGHIHNDICVFVAIELAAGNIDGGVSGLDDQNSGICANGRNLITVKVHIGNHHSVDTCVHRSNSAVIGLAIGLHTDVADLNIVHPFAVNGNKQFLCGVVEGNDEGIIRVAILIHDLHIVHIGNDDDVGNIIGGLVIGASRNCTVQVCTNLGGQSTANSNLQIANLSNIGDRFQGILQHAQGFIRDELQVLLQLAQLHSQAGAAGTQEAFQHILHLRRQQQLDLAVHAGDASAVNIQARSVNTDHKLNQRFEDLIGIAKPVTQSDIGGNIVFITISDVDIGDVDGGSCLFNGNGYGTGGGLVIVATCVLEGNLILANSIAHIVIGNQNCSTVHEVAVCINDGSADRSQQFLQGVILVGYGNIVAGDEGLSTIVDQSNNDLVILQVHCAVVVNDLQDFLNIAVLVNQGVLAEDMAANGADFFSDNACQIAGGSNCIGVLACLRQSNDISNCGIDNLVDVTVIDRIANVQPLFFQRNGSRTVGECCIKQAHSNAANPLDFAQCGADSAQIDGVFTLGSCQVPDLIANMDCIVLRSNDDSVVQGLIVGIFHANIEADMAVLVVNEAAIGEGNNDLTGSQSNIQLHAIVGVGQNLICAKYIDGGNEALGNAVLDNGNDVQGFVRSGIAIVDNSVSSIVAVDSTVTDDGHGVLSSAALTSAIGEAVRFGFNMLGVICANTLVLVAIHIGPSAICVAQCGAFVSLSVGHIAAITLGGLGAVLSASRVTVGHVVGEAVAQCGVFIGHGVGYIATVTLGSLGAVLSASRVTVGHVVGEAVAQCGVFIGHGVGLVATVALCGLSAVCQTGCVIVGHVVGEFVFISSPQLFANLMQTASLGQDDFAPLILTRGLATDEVTVEGTTGNSDYSAFHTITVGVKHPAIGQLIEDTSGHGHIAVHREEHCTAVEAGHRVVTACNGHRTSVAEHVVDNAFAVSNDCAGANAIDQLQFCIRFRLEYNADNGGSANCVCSDGLTVQVNGNLLTSNLDQRIHIANQFMIFQNDDGIAILSCVHSILDGAEAFTVNGCNRLHQLINTVYILHHITFNARNSIQAFHCSDSGFELVQNDGQLLVAICFINLQSIHSVIEDHRQLLGFLFAVLNAVDVTAIEDYRAGRSIHKANTCASDVVSGHIGERCSAVHIGQPDTVLGIGDRNVFCSEASERSITVNQIIQIRTGGVLHSDILDITQIHTVVIIITISTSEGTAVNSNVVSQLLLVGIDTIAINNKIDIPDG